MDLKLSLSLFSIAFFWGTTYLAMRIGVETIPPFLLTGLRNLLASSILFTYLFFNKQLEPMSTARIKRNVVISFMLIILSNALVAFSEQYISSGLAALIASLSPLGILVISLGLGYEKISFKTLFSITLGILGVYLIYQNALVDLFNPEYRIGIIAILTGVTMWAIGTVYSKRSTNYPGNMLVDLFCQMLFAGLFLTLFQIIVQPAEIHLSTWSLRSISATIYLAIFGSIIAYTSYMYALTRLPATKVSIFTYVNVIIAILLGWLILDEEITLKIIIATLVIISGVAIANYKKRKPLQNSISKTRPSSGDCSVEF